MYWQGLSALSRCGLERSDGRCGFARLRGDLILLAVPGRSFGNHSTEGAEHGGLGATDLAAPLILSGGGVLPGRVADPISTVQIAATIAQYFEFAAPGAQSALPHVFLGKLHRKMPPPGGEGLELPPRGRAILSIVQ